jgi:hypothetical protein
MSALTRFADSKSDIVTCPGSARKRHLRSLAMIYFSLLVRILRFGRHSISEGRLERLP